ncbi:lysE family domain protein [Burkholderia pseudomallei TSV32]|nr:lysE family domain protein [Burkholderia pseudomallei TSV32]
MDGPCCASCGLRDGSSSVEGERARTYGRLEKETWPPCGSQGLDIVSEKAAPTAKPFAHRPIPYRQPSSKLYRYCTEPIHYTHFVILALIPQTKRASP